MRTVIFLSCLGVLAVSCGGPAPPPFNPVADVKQLMQGDIDPNADVIGEATGTIVSKEGIDQEYMDAIKNANQ